MKLAPSERERRWKQHLEGKQGAKPKKQNSKKKRAGPKPPKKEQLYALSECCTAYAMANIDPWCLESGLVGIPSELPLASFKFTTRARGTFTIGASGTGYVACNPFQVANGQNNSSPIFATVISTNGIYTGDGYRYAGPNYGLAAGLDAVYCDSPFPLGLFSQNVSEPSSNNHVRVVGAGLKMRFVGSEFNRGGRAFVFRSPINTPIVGSLQTATPEVPISTLTRNKETVTVPVDREWHACLYKPAVPQDLSYAEQDDVTVIGTNYPRRMVDGPSMLIIITGGTTNQSFEWDFIGHYEAVGPNLPGFTTTKSDVVGMSIVRSALATTQPTSSVEEMKDSMFGTMGEHLIHTTKAIAEHSGHIVGAIEGGRAILGALSSG